MTAAAVSSELVPLAERTTVLHAFRLAVVTAVLATATLAPQTVGASVGALAFPTAVYALITVAVEALRRALNRRSLVLFGALLLADGAWIAAVVTRAGGPLSPLAVLVVLHVVAVTLLASYRTGLKVAVWHSLMLVVAHYFRTAGLTTGWGPPAFAGVVVPESAVVAGVASFLVLALGTAIFSSINERELRRSRREMTGLASMGTELQDVQSPDEIGTVLLRWVRDALGYPRSAVVMGDQDHVSQAWVADDDGIRAVDLVPGYQPGEVLRRCWETRQPQLVRTVGPEAPVLSRALPNAANLVVVPMVADARAVGALVVEKGGSMTAMISGTRVNALLEFAAHAAQSLRSATLLAEVQRLARVDELTGLPNRRTFDETMAREVARAARSGDPLSLVLLDVDHFKNINDAYGHSRGDEALRVVGRALAESARQQLDLAARYGGEEFALVLPGCPAAAAAMVAEEVRAAIASSCEDLRLTVSAGVAVYGANAVTAEGLTVAADEALYQSKRSGRDQVTVSRRVPPTETGGVTRLLVPA